MTYSDGFQRTSNHEQRTTNLSTTQESANHQIQHMNSEGDEVTTRTTIWQSDSSDKSASKSSSNENSQNNENSLVLSA